MDDFIVNVFDYLDYRHAIDDFEMRDFSLIVLMFVARYTKQSIRQFLFNVKGDCARKGIFLFYLSSIHLVDERFSSFLWFLFSIDLIL